MSTPSRDRYALFRPGTNVIVTTVLIAPAVIDLLRQRGWSIADIKPVQLLPITTNDTVHHAEPPPRNESANA